MKPLDKARKQVIRRIDYRHVKRGSMFFPTGAYLNKEEPEEVYVVTLLVQEGLLPKKTQFAIFDVESDAQNFVAKHPVDSEFSDTLTEKILKSATLDGLVEEGLFFPIIAGDRGLFLPWKTLKDAEISNGMHTSEIVLESLGKERIQSLIEKYQDNWMCVAEFEYCANELPHSSPAYVAAACNFCYFILEDDFKAGYLLRDLEVLVYGIEAVASKTFETRRKAGASGSLRSMQSREDRRRSLLTAMEDMIQRNPDILRLGEMALIDLSVSKAAELEPKLWSQGRAQALEYVGEIRRGEAGNDLLTRYLAVFPPKPPKRFK